VDDVIFKYAQNGQDVQAVLRRYRNLYQTGLEITYRDKHRHTLSYAVIEEIDRRLLMLNAPQARA
jgi:hypothetical protein